MVYKFIYELLPSNISMVVYYNSHVHLFRNVDVPERFVGKITQILLNRKLMHGFARLLHNLNPYSSRDQWDRYASFLDLGNDSSKQIFENLLSYYQNKQFKFVPLSMDMEFMGAGKTPRPFTDQLEELAELIAPNAPYSDIILPFVCVDPRRDYCSDGGIVGFVRYWLDRGFKGVKLYPPLGYFPWDPKLDPLYAFCQQEKIPIICHTSIGPVFYKGKPKTLQALILNAQQRFLEVHASDPVMETYNDVMAFLEKYYNPKQGKGFFTPHHEYNQHLSSMCTHPKNWEIVLHQYPQLKIDLAHFGGFHEVEHYKKWQKHHNDLPELENNWFWIILNMLKTLPYPNLYTDISATWADSSIHEILIQILEDDSLNQKILYGSDYYVNLALSFEDLFSKDLVIAIGDDDFDVIACDNPNRFLNED